MNQKGFAPLLIVLFIAAAIGGYLIYFGKINLNKTQTIPSATISPSLSPEETTHWKTYTNSELAYTIQYPASWIQSLDCRGQGSGVCFSTLDFDSSQGDFIAGTEKGAVLHLRMISGSIDDDLMQGHCNDRKLYYPSACFQDSISGKPALHIRGGVKQADQLIITNEIVSIQINPNTVVQVGFFNSSEKATQERAIFDQILSTFKFLEQTEVEGRFCGGIGANLPENQCPEGYKCKLDGDYPDAGGKCIKK